MAATLLLSRRAVVTAALPAALGMSSPAWSISNDIDRPKRVDPDGLTHTSEAIHQELTFQASPHAIYEALLTSQQFDAITRLSDAVARVTASGAIPTSISRELGGPFTLFGGYITGRNLELLGDERLVQSWRADSWSAGDYSIVKFVLAASGTNTNLAFDHRGFPEGQGKHLARGWYTHYWEPLAKYLAQR
jgi:activator of HSP90 ATPase